MRLPARFWMVLFTLMVLLSTYGFYKYYKCHFRNLFQSAIAPLNEAYYEDWEGLKNESINAEYIDERARHVLLKRVEVLQCKKEHHLFLSEKLYENNYAMLSIFPFLSAIAGIFTFFVLQAGWQNSKQYLKFGLVLFGTLTAIVGIFPEVYQQQKSIDNNIKNYLAYGDLQNEIFAYATTAPLLNSKRVPFNRFLDSLNQREIKLNQIYFALSNREIENSFLQKIASGGGG